LHDKATTAPGYAFDKLHRSCWVIIFTPGHTSDTAWANPQELYAVDLGPEPPREYPENIVTCKINAGPEVDPKENE
jgi:hypothetical protein